MHLHLKLMVLVVDLDDACMTPALQEVVEASVDLLLHVLPYILGIVLPLYASLLQLLICCFGPGELQPLYLDLLSKHGGIILFHTRQRKIVLSIAEQCGILSMTKAAATAQNVGAAASGSPCRCWAAVCCFKPDMQRGGPMNR